MAKPKIEFQSDDDGWYEVSVEIIRGRKLKVHYLDFGEDYDDLLSMDEFKSCIAKSRFRLASRQLQDRKCGQLRPRTNICASCATDGRDLTHFDAVVKKVCKSQHHLVNGEELCTCIFKVLWKAGPMAYKISSVSCENICLLTKGSIKTHPVIKDFVKLVETKKKGRKEEKKETILMPTKYLTRSAGLKVEEKLACNVQILCSNPSKRKRTNMKGRKTTMYKDKQVEPVMPENNEVIVSDLQSNRIISKGKFKNLSDIYKVETVINTPMSRIEAVLPSANQVSREMEMKTDDRLQHSLDLHSMTGKIETVALPSREIEKKTSGGSKFTLDLNLIPVDLETDQLDIPTTAAGFDSSISIENARPCQNGWLEEDDCDILQNENSGYNLVDSDIAGKSACLTADVKNDGNMLSEDHSLSVSVSMKRPLSCLVMANWDGDYNCERICEQLTVEENQKNKEITENKLEKTVFPTYFGGKDKQQKPRSNKMFASERNVQDYSPKGENINSSKNSIQHSNNLDAVDTLSACNLTTAHVKHNTSQHTKEPLNYSTNLQVLSDQNLGNVEKIGKIVDEYEQLVHNRKTSLPACNQCRTKERQFCYSEFLVLENLEKDISHCDVKKFISSMGYGIDRVYIFPCLKFEQSTRGFVWFKDRANLMKAVRFLQDDNFFIVSSSGRPWVAHIDNGICESSFEGFRIQSKDSEESYTSNKISILHKGTKDYEKAKKRKSIYLEFKDHERILHKKLDFEETNV